MIQQTGFGEPGKGAPDGDKTTCFAADAKFKVFELSGIQLRPKYALAAMRGAYLFRLNRDPPATAANIKPAAPSASMRIVSMGIPIASCANSPSNNAVAAGNQSEKEFDRPPHASVIATRMFAIANDPT